MTFDPQRLLRDLFATAIAAAQGVGDCAGGL